MVDNLYGREYGDYNTDGWLSGSRFVGSSADATLFTKPFGPCVTDTRYFGVSTKYYMKYVLYMYSTCTKYEQFYCCIILVYIGEY